MENARPEVRWMTATTEDTLLTVGETAQLLKCSKALAYRMVADGTLPVVRITSRSVRVPRARLMRWIEDRSR
jgi:excisionase family DNA binding protein